MHVDEINEKMRSELKVVEVEKESKVKELWNSYEFVKKERDSLRIELDKQLKWIEELDKILREQSKDMMNQEQTISKYQIELQNSEA